MPIKFKCPSCAKVIQAPDSATGKNVKCPHCATVMKVPGGAAPSNPTPAPNDDPFGDLPDMGGGGGNASSAFPSSTAPSASQNPYATNAPNPYSAPQSPQSSAAPRYSADSGNPLNAPGICLAVLASLHLGLAVLGLVLNLIGVGAGMQQNNGLDPAANMAAQIGQFVFVVAIQGTIAYGGICMTKLENKGVVWAALVLSVIPICSSCCILGIPFGIWGMVSMGQVDHRFKS